jgi:hypothetical protein
MDGLVRQMKKERSGVFAFEEGGCVIVQEFGSVSVYFLRDFGTLISGLLYTPWPLKLTQ